MIEKILIIVLPLIFLVTFMTRNMVVKYRTKKQIRASDAVASTSIILNSSCILITIASTFSSQLYQLMAPIWSLRSPMVSFFGLSLFGISILLGWIGSAQMRESWRIGIPKDQKTELIQNGIYAYVRNPYFLSFFVMFLGLFLVRPSLVILLLLSATIAVFHRLVLNEENYLLKTHGEEYIKYRRTTGRYIPRYRRR
jgi:protein-S-isoprenylcysteine O-methyltransferase Ste14